MCINQKDFVILYVEDEIDIRETISKTLRMIFKKVHIASNGKEALDIMNKHKIDILISDIHMPELDGVELIREVRHRNSIMPIIITTGYSEFETIYKNVYNIDTLTKPYTVFDIINKIHEMESRNKIVKDSSVACEKINEIYYEAKKILNLIGD